MDLLWITMGMDSMVMNIKQPFVKSKIIPVIGIFSALLYQGSVYAVDFQVIPSLTFRETFSDNVRLASKGHEKSAFVTEITPGISIRGINSGRLTANLDYQLQSLFNSGGVGSTKMFHQMQLNSSYELIRNRLNFGVQSNINQQNNTIFNTGDNINNVGRATIYTAGAWINWTPHFGSFAQANINASYDYIANNGAERLSNSQDVNESIFLESGRDFQRVTWNVSFDNRDSFRADASDVSFQNTEATVRTWVDKYFNFFTTVGYANNSFGSSSSNLNGVYYTVGAQWKPSWYFDIEAGYGNNWHITTNFNPTRQTHLEVGYFDRSVGLNTGGVWSVGFDHQTKNSSWQFNYSEDTTTSQASLVDRTSLSDGGALGGLGQSVLTLTNAVLVRKVANASVSYTTGKSDFQLGGFHQRQESDGINNSQETLYGVDLSWSWQVTRRTNLFLSPSWQHGKRSSVNNDVIPSDYDRYAVVTRLTRTLPLNIGRSKSLYASLEYLFSKQLVNSSSRNDLVNPYVENRVTISLYMDF